MNRLKRVKLMRKSHVRADYNGKGFINKLREFVNNPKVTVMSAGLAAATAIALIVPGGTAMAAEAPDATIENDNEGVTPIEQTVEVEAQQVSEPQVIEVQQTKATPSPSTVQTETTAEETVAPAPAEVSADEVVSEDSTIVDPTITEDQNIYTEGVVSENPPMLDSIVTEDENTYTEGVVSENPPMQEETNQTDTTTQETTDETTTEAQTEDTKEEENYLQPVEAQDGVDISDPSSNQGEVNFDKENTNLIIIDGKDGNKIVIWTDQSYGNPNQSLIHDNLVNSELTNLNGEEDYQFYSEFDYTDPETGLMHCAFDGGEVIYNPESGQYTVYYDKTMYESTMGVNTTAKEYIDPDTHEPIKPIEPTPDEPTPDEPTPDEPTPDEPTPDEPTPDEPTPDEPTPDEPTPEISQGSSEVPKTGDDLDLTGMALAGGAALAAGATALGARRKMRADGGYDEYDYDDSLDNDYKPENKIYDKFSKLWNDSVALKSFTDSLKGLSQEEQEEIYSMIIEDSNAKTENTNARTR